MERKIVSVVLTLIGLTAIGVASAEENWPWWWGPNQNGISAAKNPPTT
jgi:hypothetical protein